MISVKNIPSNEKGGRAPGAPPLGSAHAVERVMTFKLLGVRVANDLKWTYHVDAVTSQISSRLYFLKQLKRSGAEPDDLLCFYTTAVRPGAEEGHRASLLHRQRRSSCYSGGRRELSFLTSTTHRHLPLPASKRSHHDGSS